MNCFSSFYGDSPTPLVDDQGPVCTDKVLETRTAELVDDNGTGKDLVKVSKSCIKTLIPFISSESDECVEAANSPILHVRPIPLQWSFDLIAEEFGKFGKIKEIRNRLDKSYKFFETWIIFNCDRDALRASKEFKSDPGINCMLVDNTPLYLDIFRPADQDEVDDDVEERVPEPPNWLILSTQGDRGNIFKVKKFIYQKLGQIRRPDITRFGRNSFLINTKSSVQSAMLLNLNLKKDGMIKKK